MGQLSKALDEVFHVNVADVEMTTSHRKRFDYKDDVRAFVEEYKDDKLFESIPGRAYPSFPDFSLTKFTTISDPDLLKLRLQKYSKKLDRRRAWRRQRFVV